MGSSRKLTTTTRPLRRSLRLIQRKVSRLQDLPPELRDIIYFLAMEETEEEKDEKCGLHLVDGFPGTAKALSQVSHAIRADAIRVFFSKNSFLVVVGFTSGFHADVRRVDNWAKVWGTLALPHIRSLELTCFSLETCRRRISINVKDTANPITYGDHECPLFDRIREHDMNDIKVAVFGGLGEQKFSFERLVVFLTAVEDVVSEYTEERAIARVAEVLSRVK